MIATPLIPYFEAPSFHLGPLHIQAFGVITAIGIWIAAGILGREAKKRGLPEKPVLDFAVWGVVGGVVGAHFMHLFLYHPEELRENGPLQIVKVWDGLSSTGGMLGAVVAAVVFFRVNKLRFADYADALALATGTGWAIARIGCFAVHDHPGVRSEAWFSVQWPGGARLDMGLIDSVVLFAISGALFWLAHRKLLTGRLLGALTLPYGIARFIEDFFRATDVSYADRRYAGLTPAQYVCFFLAAYGLWRLWKRPAAPANGLT